MLADNLIFLRNIKGLTQEQVAEVIGISRQSYSKWEQGETYPDIDKCDKLAKYYGVTIDSLVHQDNKVDDVKIAPAPIGKHLWGTVTIGSKGQIVIPKAARETFELTEGARLVVLGDKERNDDPGDPQTCGSGGIAKLRAPRVFCCEYGVPPQIQGDAGNFSLWQGAE